MTDTLDLNLTTPDTNGTEATGAMEIPLDRLTLPAENIGSIDPDAIEQLTASIRELGVLQPIVVVELVDGLYEVAFGRHRYVAAQEAGLSTIPCVVRTFVDETERWLGMVVENLHRRTIDPVAEGFAYQRLTSLGLKQRDLAEKVGRSQSHVSKRLALAELPDTAHTALAEGRLSISGAEGLARIKDHKKVEQLASAKGQISDYKITDALQEEEREAKKAKLRQEQLDAGRTEVKSEKDAYNGAKFARATDDDATHFFVSNYGQVALLVAKTEERATGDTKAPAKPKETAAQKRERLAREKRDTTYKAIGEAHTDFIKAHLAGKIDAKAGQPLTTATFLDVVIDEAYPIGGTEDVVAVLGLKLDEEADEWEESRRVLRDFAAATPANQLKILVAAALTGLQFSTYKYRSDACGIETADQRVIDYLRAVGYEPSADEQAELDRITNPAAATDDDGDGGAAES